MNDYRNQPQDRADDLEAFERQLRSLTPRGAAFQLSVANSNESQVAGIHSPDSRLRSKDRAWVATLIATWSLGAAAGIAGTMVCSSFGTASFRSDIAAVSDSNHSSTSSMEVKVSDVGSSSNKGLRDESLSDIASANTFLPMPWSFLTKRSSLSTSDHSALAPRNFTEDLAFDSPSRITKFSLDEQNVDPTEITEVDVTAPSDNIQLPKPINQRDLMRSLLKI